MIDNTDPLLLAVRSYKNLQGKTFCILLENGFKLNLKFKKVNFYHLIGFQYLTDIAWLNTSRYSKNNIYNNIEKGIITYEMVKNSIHFNKEIEDRILNFKHIDKLLSEDIIIDFDKSKVKFKKEIKLDSDFQLYKKINKFYVHLFLSTKDVEFYPESFFARENKDYINNQTKIKIVSISEIGNKKKSKKVDKNKKSPASK